MLHLVQRNKEIIYLNKIIQYLDQAIVCVTTSTIIIQEHVATRDRLGEQNKNKRMTHACNGPRAPFRRSLMVMCPVIRYSNSRSDEFQSIIIIISQIMRQQEKVEKSKQQQQESIRGKKASQQRMQCKAIA